MAATNSELIQGLKQLIAFIEENDDIDFANAASPAVEMHWRSWHVSGSEEHKRSIISDLAKRLGKATKRYGGEFFWMDHDFGPCVKFMIHSERSTVCERVSKGMRIVPAQPERFIPAQPETEVEEFEWRCDPILSPEEEGQIA